MTREKPFELKNIIVIEGENKYPLTITVHRGLWIGFGIEKNILKFKTFRFDLSMLEKDMKKFANDSKIEKLVKGLSSDKLTLDDLSEFEIDGKFYYQIKDLEDGNYIAIDKNGQVFGLIHDPYKIELINKSVRQFTNDVNCGKFDFNKYLDGIKQPM
ncbi:hypothetical protein [Mucilaginibacter gotjawali]|nr:hypothetical protein [Mucilaginibacter gotjawali]MBB3053949.1 hypothetical protein [Mucilaginibacter gotjawali]